MRDLSRREACLAQAAVCREKAEADAANQDFWINEAIGWLELAINPAGHAVVSAEFSAPKWPETGPGRNLHAPWPDAVIDSDIVCR